MTFKCEKCQAQITIRDNMSYSTEIKDRANARRQGWKLRRNRETGLCPIHNNQKAVSYGR